MTKALIIVTSAGELKGHKTGYWLEEAAAPYLVFKKVGYHVDIASPEGGAPPLDEVSTSGEFLTEDTKSFGDDSEGQAKLRNSLKLRDVNAAEYDLTFSVGGHGTCVDFPNNPEVNDVLSAVYAAGGVVSAVCHGPMSLVGAKDPEGKPLVQGKRLTSFTNEEEDKVFLSDRVPFMLETKLCELGALFEKAPPFTPHAVADGRLVTGQNPQSSKVTAEKAVEVLRSLAK